MVVVHGSAEQPNLISVDTFFHPRGFIPFLNIRVRLRASLIGQDAFPFLGELDCPRLPTGSRLRGGHP